MKKLVVFLFAIGMLAIPLSSFADVGVNTLPTLGTGSSGVNVNSSGATMNVQIIDTTNVGQANWKSFNVGSNAKVNFDFTKANQTVINKVDATGGLSQINGQITNSGVGASTGSVILLNPNGFIFGKGATVNLNSFTAQSLTGTYSFANKKITLDSKGATGNGKITIANGANIITNNLIFIYFYEQVGGFLGKKKKR